MAPEERALDSVDLHDGRLTGIIMHGRVLELRCSAVDGTVHVVRFADVERMCAQNFREGNIIFECVTYRADIPTALIRQAYGEPLPNDGGWLSRMAERIAAGGWTLLHVTSSYGCELVALGRGSVTVSTAPHDGRG